MNTIIAFILVFGLLVFVHELGHLIFAKRAGILCREFAIGFGPKVFSFKKNETVYTIRLLPLGGFVRMAGEDPEMVEIKKGQRVGLILNEKQQVKDIILDHFDKYPSLRMLDVTEYDLEHKLHIRGFSEGTEEVVTYDVNREANLVAQGVASQIAPWDRQFNSKTIWQRTKAIIAGPAMNFVLAFILFAFIAIAQGIPVNESRLGETTADGAAAKYGLQENDQILSINGTKTTSWEDVVQIIQRNPEQPLAFEVNRDGKVMNIEVTPKVSEVDGKKIGMIGVYPPVERTVLGSLEYGVTQTVTWTKEIVTSVWKLVTGEFSIDQLSGPVGIYNYTGEVAATGIYNLLKWTAVLSINLGIVNLLPLPALDGGRLMFFAVEAVRGKPIDRQKEGMVHFVGFALLMLLMLVVTWNDIKQFFL